MIDRGHDIMRYKALLKLGLMVFSMFVMGYSWAQTSASLNTKFVQVEDILLVDAHIDPSVNTTVTLALAAGGGNAGDGFQTTSTAFHIELDYSENLVGSTAKVYAALDPSPPGLALPSGIFFTLNSAGPPAMPSPLSDPRVLSGAAALHGMLTNVFTLSTTNQAITGTVNNVAVKGLDLTLGLDASQSNFAVGGGPYTARILFTIIQ